MTITNDIRETKGRVNEYAKELQGLLTEFSVTGEGWFTALKEANRNANFRAKRDAIWIRIVEQEGGKLTLTTVLMIVGLGLGGVGIATAGVAVGIPIALLLAPFGLLVGNELDNHGWTKTLADWIRRFVSGPDDSSDAIAEDTERRLLSEALADLDVRLRQAEARIPELGRELERAQAEIKALQNRVTALMWWGGVAVTVLVILAILNLWLLRS